MRVLQLIDSLQVGGAEKTAINYANLLTKKIDQSFLCVTRKEGPLKELLIKEVGYLFLKKKSKIDFRAIKKINSFIKTNQITIVHAHATSYFFAVLLKFFNAKIKIIWHDHNGNRVYSNKSQNTILKYCSYFFNTIITVNQDLKSWAEGHLYVKNVMYLPNFSVLKEEKEQTVLHGNSGKRIVCLANLRQPKNHMFLLNVFMEVNKGSNDWSLHFIGTDFNDEYSKKLKTFIINNDLKKQVFLYGLKQDIKGILSQCDIGVLGSTSEGLPLSILEYGLAKLPVVATNVGDCNKVITNAEEGMLISSDNSTAFSKAILSYINDETLRKTTGENLYSNVMVNFSAQSALDKLISIYNN